MRFLRLQFLIVLEHTMMALKTVETAPAKAYYRCPTIGRNVCVRCNKSNLSRAGHVCTSCGYGMLNDGQQCVRCPYRYGLPLLGCVHC